MPKALIGSLALAPVGEVSVGVLHLGYSHLYVLPFMGLYSARACYCFPSTYPESTFFFFWLSFQRSKKTHSAKRIFLFCMVKYGSGTKPTMV